MVFSIGGQHGMLRPHGTVIVTDHDGREKQSDTRQCVHCGGHWVIQRGSGRPHIFCRKCGGDTCSNPACLSECVPEEKRIGELQLPS